jgi:EpsI family protein
MTSARLRAFIVLLLAAVAVAVAAAWRPTQHLSDSRPKLTLDTVFPTRFADWAVDERMPVQLISPDTQALLNRIYNQTLSRTYVNGAGDRIMLSVAYGGDQSDGTRAHRPEVCYPAQGFQLLGDSSARLPLNGHQIQARRLVARLGQRNEPITYWVTVGELIVTSGTQQKLAQLRYSTRGVIPDGMLVRVSSIDSDAQRAYRVQEAFIGELAGAITGDAKSRIFGAAVQ